MKKKSEEKCVNATQEVSEYRGGIEMNENKVQHP